MPGTYIAVGTLEPAQDLHQIINFASGGGPTRFEVLLHTQACEERQNYTRQVVDRHLRLFRLDVLGNELFQVYSAVCQHLDRRGRQDGKLPHRTDRETPFLLLGIARAEEFGGEVLAFGPWELLFGEGAYHNGMVVRFPDKDTALAWYNSPAYQALLDIRNAALDCRFRLVG